MKNSIVLVLFVIILCGCNNETIDKSIVISNMVLASSNKTVKNGETISLTTNIEGKMNGKPILFSIKYLCDDKEIGFSNDSTNNYRYDYHVENLSVGSHTLSSIAEYKEEGAVSKTSTSIPIIVME